MIDDKTFPNSFALHRIALARRLAAGECGGWYGDAVLIVSSAISALAADLYPGTSIDRRRFVQIWVRYADPALKPNMVSVPLLAQALHESGDASTVSLLRALRPEVGAMFPAMVDSLVLDGDRADASEQDLIATAPALSVAKVRQFCYPNLFYSEIRSGFVHEGNTTKFGSSHPGGTRSADISYANVVQKPFRRIHFTVDWLCRVTESIARNAADTFYLPRKQHPAVWWLDGGSA